MQRTYDITLPLTFASYLLAEKKEVLCLYNLWYNGYLWPFLCWMRCVVVVVVTLATINTGRAWPVLAVCIQYWLIAVVLSGKKNLIHNFCPFYCAALLLMVFSSMDFFVWRALPLRLCLRPNEYPFAAFCFLFVCRAALLANGISKSRTWT